MNVTATTQEMASAISVTQKIEPVYSEAVELDSPIGMKPAAVIAVPVSIGKPVCE